jgi:hypothetical protein
LAAGLGPAGCHTTKLDKAGDPLLGAAVPPAGNPAQPHNPPQTTQTPAGTPTATSANVPPIPLPAASPTNASLASQTRPKSLAITDGAAAGWQRGAALPVSPVGNPSQSNAAPRVEPVPAADSFSQQTSAPIQTTSSWTAGNRPAAAETPEQLQKLLDAHGVAGQKLVSNPTGVHLICAVPSRANPSQNVLYEVTAPDYATAVHAVVRQIEQQRQ